MLVVWALGAGVVALMVMAERMTAKRYTSMTDGMDTVGTVTDQGLTGGQYKSVVYSVAYQDHAGRQHHLDKVPLTGHIAIGDRIAMRYRPDAPHQAAPAPQHVRSNGVQIIVAAVLFAGLGVGFGFVA